MIREPKSHMILKLVSNKMPNNVVTPSTSIVLVIEQHNKYIKLCGVTALFGIILATNKHQNHVRLRVPIRIIALRPKSLFTIKLYIHKISGNHHKIEKYEIRIILLNNAVHRREKPKPIVVFMYINDMSCTRV